MTAIISMQPKRDRDRRYWPRMVGGVDLSYRVVSREDWALVSKAWMESVGRAPDGAGFREPDAFMEFSVEGLRFDDVAGPREGDRLVAVLTLPGGSAMWHVTARVVRADAIPADERETMHGGSAERTHRFAVEFISIPHRASEALVAYTERLQDFQLATTADIITADIMCAVSEDERD